MVDENQDAGGDSVFEFDPDLVEAVFDHPDPADIGSDLGDLFRLGQVKRHPERRTDLEKPVRHDPRAAQGEVLGQGVDGAGVGTGGRPGELDGDPVFLGDSFVFSVFAHHALSFRTRRSIAVGDSVRCPDDKPAKNRVHRRWG